MLFAGKGLWGRELEAMLDLTEVELITPERHRLGDRPPSEVEKARIRLVIESVFANLKGQMRLADHLAKTVGGLVHASPSDCSPSPWGSSATCSPEGRRERSSPTTAAEPTSAL